MESCPSENINRYCKTRLEPDFCGKNPFGIHNSDSDTKQGFTFIRSHSKNVVDYVLMPFKRKEIIVRTEILSTQIPSITRMKKPSF
jgi:hypothetical protein